MAKVTFRIHYGTRWGENLLFERRFLAGHALAARTKILPMHTTGDGYWTWSLDSVEPGECIEYRYVFRDERGDCRREPVFRQIGIVGASQWVVDEWLPPELPDMAFLRQAFAGTIFSPAREAGPQKSPSGQRTLKLTLRAPRVMKGYRVCVSGSSPWLGNWDRAGALVMAGNHYPLWEADIPRSGILSPVEFKFGLWSEREARLVHLEAGPNRQLRDLPNDQESVGFNCAYFRYDKRWKGAGVAIPVFSLRSETGYGIGEFTDLEKFADWAAGCGMHLVQILPVNDTTSDYSWKDSYPYNAISAMALHPIYINIQSFFEQYRMPLPDGYGRRRDALNRLPQLDYEAVLKDKWVYLRQFHAQVGAKVLRSRGFKAFYKSHGHWLKPYAAFCRLRDRFSTADFARWGEYAAYAESTINSWFAPGAPEYDEVMLHCLVQFHLDQQLCQALGAGRSRGVAFKGDLPIGIGRCSVEAWTEPELFHTDRQTGAPPDAFGELGQNWGFPTYDWQKMAGDDYAWWRRRFQKMSACFDALRIDHILGFFRIWEIPGKYAEGVMGHYNPTLPFSREEIWNYGCKRDPALFTFPSVAEQDLPVFFGDTTRKAANLLYPGHDGFLRIKPEFEAADARKAWYAVHCSVEEAARIEDGMKRLGFEVLFLEDPDRPDHFHPRVTLQKTRLFTALNPDEREVMSRMHDDFYYRRHNRFWEEEAMKKLPALMDATGMLVCGEDLGMIPASVPGVLKRLGILSLEVQRAPKSSDQMFGIPQNYPYLSVCTTSTHDLPVLRGWWDEEPKSRQAFYNQVMQRHGDAPRDCTPEICGFIVWQHLAGASMWCILPWQDWLALDSQLRHPTPAEERINVPAIPRYYWRYRMHLTIEQLLKADDFNRKVLRMIEETGRNPAW